MPLRGGELRGGWVGRRRLVQFDRLEHAEHSRSPYVRRPVLQTFGDGGDEVLHEVGHLESAERSECEPAYGGVFVLAVFLQCVDGHEREVCVLSCVRADVEVEHLLQDCVVRLQVCGDSVERLVACGQVFHERGTCWCRRGHDHG